MFFSRITNNIVRSNLLYIIRRNRKYLVHDYRYNRVQRNLNFDDRGNPKPNVWNYYSRREITTLFIQPLVVILVYVFTLWNIFKYTCNVKDLEDFVKKVRWIKD
ncbi:hypothetical protein MACK_003722 [Theileria orientalis]|uniref:Uncharacterized protein n=1 Tax=Theileria orientalis TaxID=68886 RepID=A0A976SIQ0_THEOR|nr:hypothetical protein MACK_003722 [Theileria orientalis]